MCTAVLRDAMPKVHNSLPQDAKIMFIHATTKASTEQARAFARAAAGACRLALCLAF
jgi:hypothetical protein